MPHLFLIICCRFVFYIFMFTSKREKVYRVCFFSLLNASHISLFRFVDLPGTTTHSCPCHIRSLFFNTQTKVCDNIKYINTPQREENKRIRKLKTETYAHEIDAFTPVNKNILFFLFDFNFSMKSFQIFLTHVITFLKAMLRQQQKLSKKYLFSFFLNSDRKREKDF